MQDRASSPDSLSAEQRAWLKSRRETVERALSQALEPLRKETPERLFEAMAYGLLGGGKRLRPVLVLGAAEVVGGQAGAEVLDFACAVEMVHCYSLLHDDLPAMDDDDLRRGRPTCHKVFGEAVAILAGDALLTEAFGLVARGGGPLRAELCAMLARAAGARGMVGGQGDDVQEPWPAEVAFLERLHARKTGALIAVSCSGGARAAGAEPRAIEALERYGRHLGLAFQIADDLMDLSGDPAAMGKSRGNDARQGKTNFPALLGVAAARERALLEARLAQEALRQALPESPAREALAALAAWAAEHER